MIIYNIYIYYFKFNNKSIIFGVSAGKRDQIEIFFKKKFLSKIDVDLIIWSRTFIISKKNFLSIWSLFSALTPNNFDTKSRDQHFESGHFDLESGQFNLF